MGERTHVDGKPSYEELVQLLKNSRDDYKQLSYRFEVQQESLRFYQQLVATVNTAAATAAANAATAATANIAAAALGFYWARSWW